MRVEDVMTKEVATCLPGDSMRDAAILMDESGRGTLIAVSGDGTHRVVGILTDRDVCMSVARSDDSPDGHQVRHWMSAVVHLCRPDDRLHEVLEIMETSGCRRVPVVDEVGHLLGAISLTDIARFATREHKGGLPALSTLEVCRVLAISADTPTKPHHVQLSAPR